MPRLLEAKVVKALAGMQYQPTTIPMVGGLDTQTPTLFRKPGTLRLSYNFEVAINGGYRRIDGYERYDGHASPSNASYTLISVNITGSISVGNTVTGATSSATGYVLQVNPTQLVLTAVSGTFVSGENLTVGGTTEATTTSGPTTNSSSVPQTSAQYLALAANYYRTLISAVPGSGKVLGVFRFNGVTYAFRNNAGSTAAVMYASSSSGWTAVSLGYTLAFTAGTAGLVAGATVTGGTSGATGVIGVVRLDSGSLSGSTGVGVLVFASVTGTFQAAESIKVGTNVVGTAGGAQVATTLQPSGTYEFWVDNFSGSSSTRKVYGVDGVNNGFEFDGTWYVPIKTGMSPDTPNHVIGANYHLIYAFGPSVQSSSTGFPYQWSPVTGASEIAMGDDVTQFSYLPGSSTYAAVGVHTLNRLSILYGTSPSNYQLIPYGSEIGAQARTSQWIGRTLFLDYSGITDLQQTIAFGNFTSDVISADISSWLAARKSAATTSCLCRDLSQYRLFFSDGYGLYATVQGSQVLGFMPVIFPDIVRCSWSSVDTDGTEKIFFGTDSGYVMQMNMGTSFDGAAISWGGNLSYLFPNGPRVKTWFQNVSVEVSSTSYAEGNIGWSLDYGAPQTPQPDAIPLSTQFSEAYWDSFTWDSFSWDGTSLSPATVSVDGSAENISLAITGQSDYVAPFTINSAVLWSSQRRRLRS